MFAFAAMLLVLHLALLSCQAPLEPPLASATCVEAKACLVLIICWSSLDGQSVLFSTNFSF